MFVSHLPRAFTYASATWFAVDKNLGSWSKRRSSLLPTVDVGDCIRFLFLVLFLSSLSFGFEFSCKMSATPQASNPSWGNSAASRRWSWSRCRIFPRVCSISSLVPKDSSYSDWHSALFKRSSTVCYSSSMLVTSSEGLKVGKKWISVSRECKELVHMISPRKIKFWASRITNF